MSVDVSTTVAPLLIATFLSAWTTGIVLSLAASYWARFGYGTDKTWIKCAVVLATFWACLDTACNLSWSWKWCVVYFTSPAELANMPWELTAYCFIMSTGVLGVQAFFCYRLLHLSQRNWYLVGTLGAIATGAYGIALYMGAYTIIHGDSIASFAEIQKQSWGWFASVMGVDVAISTAMLYFLYIKPQMMHGQATTSSPLRKIIIKAIQSNVLSAVCQICIVALYASFPTSLHYTYFGLIETKIYIGSFIATLNARGSSNNPPGGFDSTLSNDPVNKRLKGLGASVHAVQVDVRHEVAIEAEEESRSVDSDEKHFPPHARSSDIGGGGGYRLQFKEPPASPRDAEKGGRHVGFEQHEMRSY